MIRALSFTRPWTELVLSGAKDIENRSWRCPPAQVGQVLVVHGAKSFDHNALAVADSVAGLTDTPLRVTGRLLDVDTSHDAPTGYLGTVTVTGCHPDCGHTPCSPWAFAGQWHWTLAEARRFPAPVPGGGRLGLWTPPDDVLAAVRAVWSPLR